MTITSDVSRVPLKNPDAFYIGGGWRKGRGAGFDVIDPASEERYFTVAMAEREDVEAAVQAARQAFDHGPWPRLSHKERADYLLALGEAVRRRGDDFAALWTHQVGNLHTFSSQFSPALGGVFDYYASLADSFPFEEQRQPLSGGAFGLIVREPVGVVAAIIPWNAPLSLIVYKVAPALLAGCTIIVKASPEAPGEAGLMAELAEEAGLPPGVFNMLTADREVSQYLVEHDGVDKVSFTGSSLAGSRIGAICGERIARCTLELGGKSAAVIFDDVAIDEAADALTMTPRLMAGQVCAALTRVIVPRHRHDAMVAALADRYSALRVGDPMAPDSDVGPLAMARQRDRVEHFIAQGVAEGAVLATGGQRPANLNRGFYVEPTVFGNVANSMAIAREEIFGPVVSVIPVADEDAALAAANDSAFGLNASVFTHDAERAYRAARVLRSGTVGQNAFRTDFSMAFGGFKRSGIGREGGTEGLHLFLETKTIILDDAPPHLRG
ncbi:MAG: aldehyde dehydrogenase [Sphingobium sp.]